MLRTLYDDYWIDSFATAPMTTQHRSFAIAFNDNSINLPSFGTESIHFDKTIVKFDNKLSFL